MKKWFSLLLALMLVLALLPAVARAAEECHLIIQLESPEAGTVTGGGVYPVGVPISISATANEGWLFDRWDYSPYDFEISDPSAATTIVVCQKPQEYTITAVFEQGAILTVTADPPAGGTVSGGGTYASGATATVHAAANEGYSFVNWTEDGNQVSTDPNYSFTVSGNRNLVAHFKADTYPVIYTWTPSGQYCQITGPALFTPNEPFKVSVRTGQNYVLVNLYSSNAEIVHIGEVINGKASVTISAPGRYTITATFREGRTIKVKADPSWCGTVSGAGAYGLGDFANLTATPKQGYAFVNWTKDGEVVSTDAAFRHIVEEHATLVAHFVQAYTVTVTADPAAGGTVSGGGDYAPGATATVHAAANEGYSFVNWTEDGTVVSTDPNYSFTVAGDRALAAHFKEDTYTVTVSGGTADKDSAARGEAVKLTANVPDGQAFVEWTSDDVDSFNPPNAAVTEFAMPDKDVAVRAVCAPILIELANDSWMFTGNPITPDNIQVSLDGVDLALLSGRDYDVAFRDNFNVGNAAKVIVTMKEPRAGSASTTFTIDPANISGAVVTAPEQEADGTEQKPDPTVTWNGKELEKGVDYEIVGYDNNVEPGLAAVTVRGKGNFKGTASGNFRIKEPPAHTVTATADPAAGGTVIAEPASGPRGQEVKLTAAPAAGYQFKAWQVVKGGVTVTDDKFTMGDEDVEVKALFELAPHAVTVTDDGNGTTSADPESAAMGQEVKLTAAPNQGYQFKEWKVLSGGVTITNDTFTMGTADVQIQAVFEKIEYAVTGGGSWRKDSGKTLTLTVTRSPDNDACFGHFTGVQIDGQDTAEFTAASGSTVVTLKPSALNGLKTGKHTVAVLFDDGSVETSVKILAAYDDETGVGDNSHMFLWLGLTVCGLLGLAAAFMTRRKWMEG